MALLVSFGPGLPAAAQPATPDGLRPSLATPAAATPATATPPSAGDRKRQTEAELEAIRRDISLSAERQEALRREIDALEKDRASLAERVVAGARRVQILEKSLTDVEARIAAVEAERHRVETSLAARRAALTEVLAAVERIGRNPPPAVVVRPDDALGAVRSAILFGAVLPDLREETRALAADLAEQVRLREKAAAERETYRADLASIAEERARLELLQDERRRLRGEQQKRLDEERRRAQELAAKADGLKDLIGRLERDLDTSRRAAEQARLPPPRVDPQAPRDPARLEPAIAFDAAKKLLPLPLQGTVVRGFGEPDGVGGLTRGIYLAARSGARATSPCDGWVVYAGPFRSYGQLLIINAGGGYHVVLAGMDRIDVDLGQFVLTGEPVGTMGERRLASAAVPDERLAQPILYVEFRKDGTPVDPSPWWAQSLDEKVRG